MSDELKGDNNGHPQSTEGGFQRANFGNWTLTVQEATSVFRTAEVPRSERSIKRYCKNGTLVCRKFDFEITRRWMIDPESVDTYVGELKEIADRKHELEGQRPPQDTSGHDLSGHGTPRPEEGASAEEVEGLKEEVKTLESERDGLKINDQANKQVIQITKEERAQFVSIIEAKSYEIGRLETQLQIAAPTEHEKNDPPQDTEPQAEESEKMPLG